eukprot:UN08696
MRSTVDHGSTVRLASVCLMVPGVCQHQVCVDQPSEKCAYVPYHIEPITLKCAYMQYHIELTKLHLQQMQCNNTFCKRCKCIKH